MKRFLSVPLAVVLALTLITTVSAQEVKFKDVPADHWAAKAVYQLVKLGITQGYPDGTFRGTKNITRYETAMFLSKLAAIAGTAGMEKLESELKAELQTLKTELAALRVAGPSPIAGSYEGKYMIGNLLAGGTVSGTKAPVGPIVNYRLKTTLARELDEEASLKLNFDTMDAGFYGASTQNLATQLLDVEGKFKANLGLEAPVNIVVTAGPGPQTHSAASNAQKSETGIVYLRPWNSVSLSTILMGMDVSGSYIARELSSATVPEISIHHLSGTVGCGAGEFPLLGKLKLSATGDLLTKNPMASPAGPQNFRTTVGLTSEPADKVKIAVTVGAGKVNGLATKNLLAGAELKLADYFQTGTDVAIKVTKVGDEYLISGLAEGLLAGLDVFDKPLVNGITDVSGEFTQIISDKLKLVGKGDLRMEGYSGYSKNHAKSSLTAEGGVFYDIAPAAVLSAMYKLYNVPSDLTDTTQDLATLGLIYKF